MPPFDRLADALPLTLVATLAALASFAVLPPLMPLLRRYALARPNARSSHQVPTPQGGGIAVAGVVLVLLALILAGVPGVPTGERTGLVALLAAALTLTVLGAIDDVRPLPALPRLAIQAAAVAVAVGFAPPEARLWPDALPIGIERALVTLAGLWFVNLYNFMDGLDWMTVAETLPIAAALALLAATGAAPVAAGVVAAATGGAMAGFAPYNRPVARLFLGDVGSLPVGLLLGWALFRLAGDGHLLPALILPLYYLADATLTLIRRIARREAITQAHRTHFYQRATVNGLPVRAVVGRVLLVNLTLAGTAVIATLAWTAPRGALAAAVAAFAVAALLVDFATPHERRR